MPARVGTAARERRPNRLGPERSGGELVALLRAIRIRRNTGHLRRVTARLPHRDRGQAHRADGRADDRVQGRAWHRATPARISRAPRWVSLLRRSSSQGRLVPALAKERVPKTRVDRRRDGLARRLQDAEGPAAASGTDTRENECVARLFRAACRGHRCVPRHSEVVWIRCAFRGKRAIRRLSRRAVVQLGVSGPPALDGPRGQLPARRPSARQARCHAPQARPMRCTVRWFISTAWPERRPHAPTCPPRRSDRRLKPSPRRRK